MIAFYLVSQYLDPQCADACLSGHIRTPSGARMSSPFAALDTDKASSLSITTATTVSSLTIVGGLSLASRTIAAGTMDSLALPSLPEPASFCVSATVLTSIVTGFGTTRPRPPAGAAPPIPRVIAYAAVRPNAGGLPKSSQGHAISQSLHAPVQNDSLLCMHRASIYE